MTDKEVVMGESHIDFPRQYFIMSLACGGNSLIIFPNSEKLSNLKVHAL